MVLFFPLSKIPLTQQMTFHLKGTKAIILDELRHHKPNLHTMKNTSEFIMNHENT